MKIIGLAYKKRVGKNTAAALMHTHLSIIRPKLEIQQVSFADLVKKTAHELFSWGGMKPGQHYENHPEDKEAPTEIRLPCYENVTYSTRNVWIEIGNKMREIHPDVWLRAAFEHLKGDVVIFTDVRFRNEADEILNEGGLVFNINRPNVPRGTDPAEVDLDGYPNFTGVINNDGTLKEFNQTIVDLTETLFV